MQPLWQKCVLPLVLAALGLAQSSIDARNQYERVFAIVPLTGKGTVDDPKRPTLAPAPAQVKTGDRSGVIAYHYEVSDDGKSALVEMVFADRAAAIAAVSALAAQNPGKAFRKGQDKAEDIEKAFQAQKNGFQLAKFFVRVQ